MGLMGVIGGGITLMGGSGPRHWIFAESTALCASTSPLPVEASGPTTEVTPAGVSAVPLHLPVVTSRAVFIMISLICLGVSFPHACLMSAATPASCGAAAEVPLKAAHP